MNVYDFTANTYLGDTVSLEEYRGKVLLIINSATECGFTPQYDYLQDMYEQYAEDGFEILDFPCNQFGHQAPGTEGEIHLFCSQRFGITFPMFEKIEVNGEQAHPLFTYLKSVTEFHGFHPEHELSKTLEKMLAEKDPNYSTSSDIKWNFTKFLIDRDGNVVERFEPTDFKEDIEDAIKDLL